MPTRLSYKIHHMLGIVIYTTFQIRFAGVFEVQLDFKPDSAAVCDNGPTRDCSIDLKIPINGRYLPWKCNACHADA